jgi:hypothetical protein
LANPGAEYLIYQPEGGKGFSAQLAAGTYECEWFNSSTAKLSKTADLTCSTGEHGFEPPFPDPAVLYLHAAAKSTH